MDISGRSALVTGGASGLGEATVRQLVASGMKVCAFDMNYEGAKALADELGPDVVAAGGNVTNDEDVQGAIALAADMAPLSVIGNIAGIGHVERTISRDGEPHSMDSFRRIYDVHVIGMFNVARWSAAAMAKNDPDDSGERGVIVNTASAAAFDGQTGQLAYASAKSAIVGMSLPMARDLAPVGIRVCSIAPGVMGTPLLRSLPEKAQQGLVANVMHPKRLGEPQEFGLLVEQIARNGYLNAESIRLDAALRFPPK